MTLAVSKIVAGKMPLKISLPAFLYAGKYYDCYYNIKRLDLFGDRGITSFLTYFFSNPGNRGSK